MVLGEQISSPERAGAEVFLSTDYGTSWTAVDSGLTNLYVCALAVSPNGAGGTEFIPDLAGIRYDVIVDGQYVT